MFGPDVSEVQHVIVEVRRDNLKGHTPSCRGLGSRNLLFALQ
jgi:hypothetical protein